MNALFETTKNWLDQPFSHAPKPVFEPRDIFVTVFSNVESIKDGIPILTDGQLWVKIERQSYKSAKYTVVSDGGKNPVNTHLCAFVAKPGTLDNFIHLTEFCSLVVAYTDDAGFVYFQGIEEILYPDHGFVRSKVLDCRMTHLGNLIFEIKSVQIDIYARPIKASDFLTTVEY